MGLETLPSRHAIFTRMACYKMNKNSKVFWKKEMLLLTLSLSLGKYYLFRSNNRHICF